MTETAQMRTWAEISLDRLAHNYQTLRAMLAPDCRFLGLCKANAYGHGALQVGRKLEALGADMLAVACVDEAAELRHKTYYGRAYDAETSFYEQAFTAAEKAMILDDKELGRVFLPSADDLKNADYGFGTNPSTKAYGTQFAIAEGLFRYSNGSSPYWTRTQSADFPYGTRCTKEHGNLGYIRCVVMNEGIRPAVRLDIGALELSGGDGTMENPYLVKR